MPRDPENYSAHDYEDEETEFETDWTPYTENMRHAESHLELFLIASEIAPHNDIGIGQQAQNTLEFAMRALLEAHEAPYRRNHDIGNLLGSIRRWDPELRNFELSIPPNIYTDYEGERQYRRREQPRLTDFPGYRERTAADAERIMRRARAVQTARRAES